MCFHFPFDVKTSAVFLELSLRCLLFLFRHHLMFKCSQPSNSHLRAKGTTSITPLTIWQAPNFGQQSVEPTSSRTNSCLFSSSSSAAISQPEQLVSQQKLFCEQQNKITSLATVKRKKFFHSDLDLIWFCEQVFGRQCR